MHIETLKQVYRNNDVVRAICDHMALRAKNQYETGRQRIEYWLASDGYDFKRSEVIAAFRSLEQAECGRYVEGRHGWKSRFVWAVQSKLVADAAQGLESKEAVETDTAVEEITDEAIEHTYVLRPDLTISVELPADLTRSEAQRLAQFVGSLSFDE
ncbi:hypothetical protein K8U54_12910 [Pseudomonas fulva]|uniref:hypothetical protein n=1 Tax=Pseudomonas fulva TaxID=47880 RepID=UPI00201DF650|nr:hypothetical protein [Pseudomonas fulva]UQY32644.1 hypothetical protein K8U54_12910 [Pseudomonas fulva]